MLKASSKGCLKTSKIGFDGVDKQVPLLNKKLKKKFFLAKMLNQTAWVSEPSVPLELPLHGFILIRGRFPEVG